MMHLAAFIYLFILDKFFDILADLNLVLNRQHLKLTNLFPKMIKSQIIDVKVCTKLYEIIIYHIKYFFFYQVGTYFLIP